MSHIEHLGRRPVRVGAFAVTQRHVGVALAALAALGALSCATAPKAGMGASVDFLDGAGREGTLAPFAGKIVVLDVCASWATACNINARVLDEVVVALTETEHDDDVVVLTLLLDEGIMGTEAVRSYAETLHVKHAVVVAGPRVRAGTSILGATGYVPRVVLFDRTGAVRVDDSGGVINVEGMLARLQPLL